MEFLGVGPLELVLILLLVILFFSPKDIAGSARSVGRSLRTMYRSDAYRVVKQVSNEIRELPTRLVKEAELEDIQRLPHELKKETEIPNIQQMADETMKVPELRSPKTESPIPADEPIESNGAVPKQEKPAA